MNRRDSVLSLLAAAAAGESLSVRAQEQRSRGPLRIGLLPDVRPEWEHFLQILSQMLRESGRIEGRDYVFYRSGVFYGGDEQQALDRVMQAQPDLLITINLGFAIEARKISKTIPIVMWISGFPVEGGVAESLARPGKNVTGLTIYAGGEVFGKLVQLVHEAKPSVRRVGFFMSYVPPFHPRAEADLIIRGARDAAGILGLDLRVFEIATPEQVDAALASVVAQGVGALVLTGDPSMRKRMKEVLQFAASRHLPTIADAPWNELGPPQPLLVYMPSLDALMRQLAPYVNQILWHGAKPGDLPIQLPARFDFVVDLKTAKLIGVALPPSILQRATEVVQ